MKRAQKMSVIAAVAVLGSLAWLCLPSGAHATPIFFGNLPGPPDPTLNFTFTGIGNGDLRVLFSPSGPGFSVFPAGYNCPAILGCGTASLRATFFEAHGVSSGTFLINQGSQGFGFSQPIQGAVDNLAGTIQWQLVQGEGSATLTGFITINSSSGDAAFVNDFPAGSIAAISLTMNFPPGSPTLDELAFGGGGQLAGHNLRGSITPVPEPSSLLLVSSALIGLGAIARRLGVMT